MGRISTAAVLGVALVGALAITLLSANTFFLARGSDATVRIHTVPLYAQILTFLVVAVAWTASAASKRLRRAARWSMRAAGLAVLALGTHVISINFKRGVLEEHWLLWRVDRATFNVADGLVHEWSVEPIRLGYQLSHRTNGTGRFLFSGIAPCTLDLDSSLVSEEPPD